MVLPPTVLGFYLLLALGPMGLAVDCRIWGGTLAFFSFPGLVIGSVIASLPFMVQPLRNAFAAIPQSVLEAAESLGRGGWRGSGGSCCRWRRQAISCGIMAFAHTVANSAWC